MFKRRAMRVVHAQLDLGAVGSAAIVARRAASLGDCAHIVEPRRTELRALATETDAALAGSRRDRRRFLGAAADRVPPATRWRRPRAARRPRLRLASRAFDDEIARGEAIVRNVVPALARSPLRAGGCWVLRTPWRPRVWTPEALGASRAPPRPGAATVRVDLERAYDRRDFSLPLSTEARHAVCLCVQSPSTPSSDVATGK